MSCIRIGVLQLSGRQANAPAVSIERALTQACRADVIVLDLFSSHSAAPNVLAALTRVHRPVRVVGASAHWKRVLQMLRLGSRFHIVEQAGSLCPPVESPGLQYTELRLGAPGKLDPRKAGAVAFCKEGAADAGDR